MTNVNFTKAQYVRPNPYHQYPYFAAHYLGGKGLRYSAGSWYAVFFAKDKEEVHRWILQQMADHLNGFLDYEGVAQHGPVVCKWITAIEAGNFLAAMELARVAAEHAEDQPAWVGGLTVACAYTENDDIDDLVFSEGRHFWSTGDLSNDTPWDADYEDIWVDQQSHQLIPLTNEPLVIRDEIKQFAQEIK